MTRQLNEDEIEILLNLSLTAESTWYAIVGSPDRKMTKKLKNIFDHESIILKHFENGADILVETAYNKPDLLILDENIEDISNKKIIDSLKKISGLRTIKIICAINETANNQSPEWGADDYFIKSNMDKVYLLKKINSLLYTSLPEDSIENKYIHTRKWPRINIGITANIELFDPENPEEIVSGEAKVLNISRNGAFLTDIRLKNGKNPSKSAHVKLRIIEEPLKDFEAESVIVRLIDNEDTGVEFTSISKEDRIKINMLFDD